MSLIHFERRSDDPEQPPRIPTDFTRACDSIWGIFADYLQPNSDLSLDVAVDQVSQFWVDMALADPPQSTEDLLGGSLPMLPVEMADLIPYDHPSHNKLVEFIVEFARRGKWLVGVTDEKERALATSRMWDTISFRIKEDEWLDAELLFEEGMDPLRYANFCAFVAKFIFPSDQKFHHELASCALKEILEVCDTETMDVRDAWVIGAAQFIVYQAPTILDRALKSHYRLIALHREAAERVEAMNCFSRWRARRREPRAIWDSEEYYFFLKDWKAWKDAFRAAATNDEMYSKTCRDIAQNAADLMALQEKIRQDDFPQEV